MSSHYELVDLLLNIHKVNIHSRLNSQTAIAAKPSDRTQQIHHGAQSTPAVCGVAMLLECEQASARREVAIAHSRYQVLDQMTAKKYYNLTHLPKSNSEVT